MAFQLSRPYVEHIHDELVPETMAFDEPVDRNAFKDLGLLDSAVNRPFQTFGGQELYDNIFKKAAALFHSLTCNHCFHNGNKRTAVVALDLFLAANDIILALPNLDVYQLAKDTASGTENLKTPQQVLDNIIERVEPFAVSLDVIKEYAADMPEDEKVAQVLERFKNVSLQIRSHPLNAVSN